MTFSLHLSMTGWLLALLSFFTHTEEPPLHTDVNDAQVETSFNCGPELICTGYVTVDLTDAPQDTVLTVKVSDLLYKYEENFSSCTEPFYFKVEWEYGLDFEDNEFIIDCSAYNATYKYSIYRGNGDDSCWGFFIIENYPYDRCSSPLKDSLQLANFYQKTGGNSWDIPWDLEQPMSSWYGVRLNEEGLVDGLDLDGIPDFQYSPEGGGNNLTGGNINFDLLSLKFLSVANNKIDRGRLFYSELPELEYFYFSNNRLTKVEDYEDFSRMPKLRELRIDNNQLSFDDLLHSVDELSVRIAANGGSYTYAPQAVVKQWEYTANQPGAYLDADLEVDDTVSTNVYTWYRHGEVLETRYGDNTFQLSGIGYADRGWYQCEITNPMAPDLTLTAEVRVNVNFFTDCPTLVCRGDYSVDLSEVPANSALTFRMEDLIFPDGQPGNYEECFSAPLEFYVDAGGQKFYNNDGTNNVKVPCNYLFGSIKFAVEDTLENPGNNCWGFIQLNNPEDFICQSVAGDSLALVDFYNNYGGPSWTNAWDLNQPVTSWYGVSLNEEGLVECLDLDGVWDCQYSPAGSGNNLTGGAATVELYSLKFLSLANNQLDKAEVFTSNLPELEELYFSNNQLALIESQQDFGGMPKLRELRIDQNQLSFDDILLSVETLVARTAANGGSYVYSPQSILFNYSETIKGPNQTLYVNLGVDELVSTNIYTWYKDDELYQTFTGVNDINFEYITHEDAGLYRCEITNPLAPDLTLTAFYTINVDFSTCPQLTCVGTYTVNMDQVPDFSNLDFRLQDLLVLDGDPYTGPCSEAPLEFYLSVDDTDFYNLAGSDVITLDCEQFVPTFKYAIEDTLNNSGNNCWGYIMLINLGDFQCKPATADSLALVDFYNNTGGPNWINTWDLNQPMSTWYGVALGAGGKVTCLDLDGNADCLYSPNGGGNDLTGGDDIVNLPSLQFLSLANNHLLGAGISASALPALEEFYLTNNWIAEVSIGQDFAAMPKLRELRIDQNQLSFDDILFSVEQLDALTAANGGSYVYGPQTQVYDRDFNIDFPDLNLRVDLPIDDTVSTNVYTWYKNDAPYRVVNGDNELRVESITQADEGNYRCEITNPLAPDLTLIGTFSITTGYACPQLYCQETYEVDMSTVPDFSSLNFYLQDLVFPDNEPYVDNCSKAPLAFSLMLGEDEYTNADGSDSIRLACKYLMPSFQYTVTDTLDELGNSCWGTIQLLNFDQFECFGCRTKDSLALVDLYLATDGPNWHNTWDLNQPIDTWYGVELNENGCVVCLDLDGEWNCGYNQNSSNGNRLIGTLPDLQLPNLRFLSLTFNYELTGPLPDFSDMPMLEFLGLGDGELLGPIPDFNLPNLKYLSLGGNNLTGSVPDFTQMPQLELFQAGGNQLTGELPDFAHLPRLKLLMLANNELSGPLPKLEKLPELESLLLWNNHLSGEIPDYGDKPKFFQLDLSGNDLVGTLPGFSSLPIMANILVADNQLSGSIPSYDHLPLIQLDLANNNFSGCVPELPGEKLYMLNVKNNDLDCTEADFTGYTELNTLILDGNQFTFEDIFALQTPDLKVFQYAPQREFFRDTLIRAEYETALTLDLGIDQAVTSNSYSWYQDGTLRATIPGNNQLVFPAIAFEDAGSYYSVVTNPALPDLELQSRTITIEVTPPGCRANDSLALVLFYQIMGGPGWNTTWNLQQPIDTWYGITVDPQLGCVTAVDLSGNNVKGQLNALRDWNIERLTYLDLSDNDITGSIPAFTRMSRLQELLLAGNNLKSGLPAFTGQPELTRLDLADNDLTGYIPAYEHLENLQELHLENNRFTFEDILPNVDKLAPETYVPQQMLRQRASIQLMEYESLTLDLQEDAAVANNQYKWFKDSVAWRNLLGNNKLHFDTLRPLDSGTYYCLITNPQVPDLVISTNLIRLQVVDDPLPRADAQDPDLDPETVPDGVFEHEGTNIGEDGDGIILPGGGIDGFTGRKTQPALSLYPNPARHTIQLEYTIPAATSVQIFLTDLYGRTVETIRREQHQRAGSYQYTADVGHLPAGIYLVNLQTATESIHSRLVISR